MWKNTTSFSQSDKKRIPTTFEARYEEIRIVVTCGHIDFKGKWIMHCHTLNMTKIVLEGCNTVEEAKTSAILLVRAKILMLRMWTDKIAEW
jgi:hypothetical protein